jgi:uncharacterized surface protein with fasciclin (FAS1) repeats
MLIKVSGLQDIFECSGSFTLLLPSNKAFDAVDGLVPQLLLPENLDVLRTLLLYHALPGSVPSSNLVAGPLETLADATVLVNVDPIMFNDADVVDADNTACNGLFHVINGVLFPHMCK